MPLKDATVSKTVEEQRVELINKIKVTDNVVTVGQQTTVNYPDLFCLTSAKELEHSNDQEQRVDMSPVEIVDAHIQTIADIIASPLLNCTPIVLPTVLK